METEKNNISECDYCGKPIRWFELNSAMFECPYVKIFVGLSHHMLGCSYMMRGIGVLLKIPIVLILVVIELITLPFMIFKRVLSGELCGGW